MSDLGAALRARGMRLTPQRRRIVDALTSLEHGTPDAVAAKVTEDGGAPLPLSTIYRGLDALEELGIVSHTHLDHRAPTYHLADHATHIHLVCLGFLLFSGRIGPTWKPASSVSPATEVAAPGYAPLHEWSNVR